MILRKKTAKNIKQGITLVEVMITIFIIIVSLQGFSLLFVNTWRSNAYTLEMGRSSMAVSQGVGKIVNYIRGTRQADNGAYPISSATDNDLVLYSDYDKDGVTERLHFYKNNLTILMGIREPTATMPRTYPSGDQETLTIADHIVNAANEPIFYYYNRDYPGDTANNPLATPADVSDIRLMKIHLKINIDPNRAPDNIQMQTFVEMRNLSD